MPSPTQVRGFTQEAVAETHLQNRGYVICERNWKGGGAEVDRIAWDGDILCFIEVRARTNGAFGSPAATVGRRKQRRLVRVAMAYLMQFPPRQTPMVRFDVVSIRLDDGRSHIELIRNAFDAGA